MLHLIFARKNHRIFYQKFMLSRQSSTDACCRNILSNDFECKARLELTKIQDLTILLVF